MQDVVIQRCTVRVVRRSGWSWGADRRALIRRVTDAVPALIAERLAALLGDTEGPATIAEPIRVRIKLRLADILAAAPSGGGAAPAARAWRARFEHAIDDAVSEAMGAAAVAAAAVDAPVMSPSYRPASPRHFVEELIDAIRSWRKAGVLAAVIERLDEPQVRAWIEALALSELSVETATTEGAPAAGAVDEHQERAAARRHLTSAPGFAPPSRVPAEVDRASGQSDAPADSSHDPAWQRDAKHASTPVEVDEARADPSPASASPSPMRAARSAPIRGGHAATPTARDDSIVEGEAHVPSALPWLILGPLHKLGYLRTLGAALDAASLRAEAPLFGAALALKLTPHADRPWSKSAVSERLAAAAAARRQPISKIDLHRFGARLAPYCPLVDATIVAAIVAGRDRGDPWVVHRVPAPADAGDGARRFGVVDPTGLFPVAWGCRATDAAAILRDQPGAGCLVLEGAADAALTNALEDSGVRFFTSARPGRNESWQAVPGLAAWRTNRSGDVPVGTRRWLRGSDEIAARLEAIAGEFGVRRVALARDPLSNLERSLALAVSVALATLAWTIWHPREVTDALLMLQRFEDLDARVRFTRRVVRVTVPLGRRHRDLLDGGLLTSVNDVPWLDGRVLEFSGG